MVRLALKHKIIEFINQEFSKIKSSKTTETR
jgi:hypothetical protein